MSDQSTETRVHRALADERRVRILAELRGHPAGLDARELAQRLELHPNTIRWHLAVLADAGIVDSHPGERTTPGRPRVVFTVREGGAEDEGESYRLLATIVTGALAQVEGGAKRAEEAGRAWGRYLVDRPPPLTQIDDDAAVQQIIDLLEEHGFRPESVPGEIRMHRCPFRDLAENTPSVVCGVHLGLISGALAELSSSVEVERLDAFVEPELCVARLRKAW